MRNKSSKFWGLVLVVVGIMFLGNNLDWWNVNLFFRGWWTLFIIIPSIYGLFDNTDKTGSSISLIVGILLLLAEKDIISYGMMWKILFPIIIIIVGLSLICKTNLKRKMRENSKEYVAVFSGVDEKIKEVVSDFKAISIFGSVELDLRKAKIEKDLYIEAVTVFGGIDLKLPENVKVQTSGVPIFGGVENKCLDNKEGVVVTIHYTCVFGGIDIF